MSNLEVMYNYILGDKFTTKKTDESSNNYTQNGSDISIFFDPTSLFKEGTTEKDFIKKYQEIIGNSIFNTEGSESYGEKSFKNTYDLSSISEEYLNDIEEVAKIYFEAVDTDNDGVISEEEVNNIALMDGDSETISDDDIESLTNKLFSEEKLQQNESAPNTPFDTGSQNTNSSDSFSNNNTNTHSTSGSQNTNSSNYSPNKDTSIPATEANSTDGPKATSKEDLEKQLSAAQSDLQTKQGELDAVFNNTDSTLAALKEKETNAYNAYYEELNKVEPEMAKNLNEMVGQISQLDSDISNSENSIISLEQNISNLKAQQSTSENPDEIQSKINDEEQKLADAKTNLEKLKAQKEALNIQKQGLEAEITAKHSEIAQLMGEYNTAKTDFETKKAEMVSAKKNSVVEANKKVQEIQAEIAEFEAEEEKLNEVFDGSVTGYEMKKYTANGQSYYALVPEGIDKNEEIPLAVYMHGYGERGDSSNLLNDQMYLALKDMAADPNYKNFKGAIVFVHSKSNACWDDEKALASADMMINDFINNSGYNISDDGVSLMGFSNGGGGVGLYYNYPQRTVKIKNATVMAGYWADKVGNMFSEIPVLVYTGTDDSCQNPHRYREYAREHGLPDEYNISLPGVGHGGTPRNALFMDSNGNGVSDFLEHVFLSN